jgi:cobalt-zinc-cadmium efflux system outer membrane protein
LKLEDAVRWALQNNPDLAAIRQQRGIASAAVVIAQTYPFNPSWTSKVFAASGPESAGITNRVALEEAVGLDLELRHQGRYRRQAASAALTRADWEIAYQEELVALKVVRGFKAAVYQHAKLNLAEESIRLNERTVDQVSSLVMRNLLRPADLIVARSEVHSTRVAVDSSRAASSKALQDLRRAMGSAEGAVHVEGRLQVAPTSGADQPEALLSRALGRRPDLQARHAAVTEAEARLRLARADRFGNPNLRPDYERNETSVDFYGAQIVLPLPVFNTHRGEILQREAERNRAALDVRATEVAIRLGVDAALERMRNARALASTYRTQVIPALEGSLKDEEALFVAQGAVPVLSMIDLRRKLLKAQDGYLDALYEVSQAQVDLAEAVGDPDLAIAP